MTRAARAVLGLVVLVGGLITFAPPAVAAMSSPVVSPASPFVGHSFTVTGTVPGRTVRSVRLEVWDGKQWAGRASTRTDSTGRYRFSRASSASPLSQRVRVPATRVAGRLLRAEVSPVRTVRQRDDSIALTAPPSVPTGQAIALSGRIASADSGRRVALQRAEGTTWATVTTALTSRGVVSASFVPRADTERLRLVLLASGLRRGATSVARTVTVTTPTPTPTPDVTTPTPTPTPTPTVDPPDEPVAETVPRLTITTAVDPATGEPAAFSQEYVRATMKLDPRDSGVAPFDVATRLRIRGNSTAWALVKLSLKVKLDTSTSLAGFPKSKDWVLLSNFYDRSLLRNDVAFEASRRIGLAWSPRMQPVEVVVNGRLQGLYDLGEGVEKAADRVVLPKSGVLLEADFHDDDGPQFVTTRGLRVFLKDPNDQPAALTDQVAAGVQHVEDVLYGDDFADPEHGYRSLVDVDSFVRWYLLNELMKNVDSTFHGSIWMSWSGGRLAMAAPWDFDLSAGTWTDFDVSDPTGWYVGRTWWSGVAAAPGTMLVGPDGHYLNRMLDDPWFRDRVAEVWAEVAPALRDLPAEIDRRAAGITPAATRNFAPVEDGGAGMPLGMTWIDFPSSVFHGSWTAEATALSTWIDRRVAWMDTQLTEPSP